MQEKMSIDACLYSACFAHLRSIFHMNIFNIRDKALIFFQAECILWAPFRSSIYFAQTNDA